MRGLTSRFPKCLLIPSFVKLNRCTNIFGAVVINDAITRSSKPKLVLLAALTGCPARWIAGQILGVLLQASTSRTLWRTHELAMKCRP